MTCKCGMSVCYLCNEGGISYNHFRAIGGCPLYSRTAVVNEQNRLKGAVEAAKELGKEPERNINEDVLEDEDEDDDAENDQADQEPELDMGWCRVA